MALKRDNIQSISNFLYSYALLNDAKNFYKRYGGTIRLSFKRDENRIDVHSVVLSHIETVVLMARV